MRTLKVFLAIIPVLLVLDLMWLGVVMKNFYNHELGDLARRQGEYLAPRWGAALCVYLLIPGGLVLFVRPLLGTNATAWQAFGWGAAFGLVLYGVYDLTNLAMLDKWTVRMTLADIAWGCMLCGATSVAMQFLSKWLSE